MLDDLEDLESMQRRIRDEARRRRQEELQRRRAAREARRRRSSSASSCDLLASSSPSPSPSPPPAAQNGASAGAAGTSQSNVKSQSPKGSSSPHCKGSSRTSANSPPKHSCTIHSSNEEKQLSSSITPRIKFGSNSDSDSSDGDFAASMSQRLAEQKRLKEMADAKVNATNTINTVKRSALWDDDSEDEDEMDVKQLVAKRAAEKRKREMELELELMASSDGKMKSNNEEARTEATQEGSSDCTPKISNSMKHAKLEKGPSPHKSEQSLSALNRVQNDDPPIKSATGDKLDGTILNTSDVHNAKATSQQDVPAKEGEEHLPNDELQTTLKSEASSRSNGLSTKSPADEASSQHSQSQIPDIPINADPIIGEEVRAKSNVDWSVHKQCLLVRTVGSCSPKSKVASFDLDNTLVNWRIAGWPSRPEHYELWNSNVITKMRQLHDDGYKLVIFSNQGGIKSAFTGKKAGTVKNIIDWIAKVVGRPLYAVCSTKTNAGYHKGNPAMWGIMEDHCNCGKEAKKHLSFFVGDADGKGDENGDAQKQKHQQSGSDKAFAENVGVKFYTPVEYFGLSNIEHRQAIASSGEAQPPKPLSRETMVARAALLGGYLSGPILLILVGVQGSGKSTFCQSLIDNGGDTWRHFSQDTIKNGRPGTRQQVEDAAREAIKSGKNVVIDRMHLDETQRSPFIQLGKSCQVPVHALVMMASKGDVEKRVKQRVNHPGKVEGDHGARIAVASLSKLIPPTYDEGFALISYTRQIEGRLWYAYQNVSRKDSHTARMPKTIELYNGGKVQLPMITLGTMNINKQATTNVVSLAMKLGINSIDTAPTYNNEREVGAALQSMENAMVTIKVPKRATTPEQARAEVMKSLSLLQCSKDTKIMILLHWPCDFIVADTLQSVWKELEKMKQEGLCDCIGVSNFSIVALQKLLSSCTIKPAVNQVERHPLLPQYNLIEFCQSQDIVVQAHTSLGQGSELLLHHDTISRVAGESSLSPAQVLLAWSLQQNVPAVTKFSTEDHGKETAQLVRENIKLGLSHQQMKLIDEMSLSSDSHRFVAPPFMFRKGVSYSWGDSPP